jgi:hypothetical protein
LPEIKTGFSMILFVFGELIKIVLGYGRVTLT